MSSANPALARAAMESVKMVRNFIAEEQVDVEHTAVCCL
jgi:hypothetical protein